MDRAVKNPVVAGGRAPPAAAVLEHRDHRRRAHRTAVRTDDHALDAEPEIDDQLDLRRFPRTDLHELARGGRLMAFKRPAAVRTVRLPAGADVERACEDALEFKATVGARRGRRQAFDPRLEQRAGLTQRGFREHELESSERVSRAIDDLSPERARTDRTRKVRSVALDSSAVREAFCDHQARALDVDVELDLAGQVDEARNPTDVGDRQPLARGVTLECRPQAFRQPVALPTGRESVGRWACRRPRTSGGRTEH